MKRIEKALNERLKDARQEIISIYCPHEFGMKDTCFEGCYMSCEECWNMEIEENTDGDCIQKNA